MAMTLQPLNDLIDISRSDGHEDSVDLSSLMQRSLALPREHPRAAPPGSYSPPKRPLAERGGGGGAGAAASDPSSKRGWSSWGIRTREPKEAKERKPEEEVRRCGSAGSAREMELLRLFEEGPGAAPRPERSMSVPEQPRPPVHGHADRKRSSSIAVKRTDHEMFSVSNLPPTTPLTSRRHSDADLVVRRRSKS